MMNEPSSQDAGSRQNAAPEPAVRQRQPARQADAASAPWLPPGLSELLPRLALPAALLAIPIAAAVALQIWLSPVHVAYDANLRFEDGSTDKVTALQWSLVDGALFVGTRSGSVKSIGSDGLLSVVLEPGQLNASDAPDNLDPVQSFASWTSTSPLILFQDRSSVQPDAPASGYAATPTGGGVANIPGGLFAFVEANNGSAVVGQAGGADSGQQYELPNNSFSNVANQPAPQQIHQQAQQQQLQPTGEQLKGEPIAQEALPIDPRPGGPARYNLTLFRDLRSSSSTSVGEIFGIEDVRAVAALPGTDTVIAGDGAGNVFAIDASQQISGVSPETYIRGIGRHEAAIVEIAVATQPAGEGVLFATRAEDRSVKVWRGSVSRASQLIPLGDYFSTDVTTPGSTWVRESVSFAVQPSTDQSTAALLSMSDDGRRILARRANLRLVIFDLPAQGEAAAATEYSGPWDWDTQSTLAVLSRDGSRILISEGDTFFTDPASVRDWTEGTRFRGLAGIQFRRFAFDGTGQRFVAIATNGSIYVQNVATPDQAVALTQYQGTGVDAAISPDGSLVAVAEQNGQIVIHSAEDGSELTIIDGPQNLGKLSFDSSGKRLRASTTDTLRLYTYSLRNLRSTTYDAGLPADAGLEGFTPNGDRYFMRDRDAGYRIVDIDSNADVGTLAAAANATGWVSNLDGSRIATLGGGGNISLFRREESPTANGPMPVIADNAMRLSADGRVLVVGDRGGELYLARLDGDASQAGYRLRRLALPAPALQYEIAPDGTAVATAEADGTVSISDLTFDSSAPDVPADNAQTGSAEQTPAGGVTVTDTLEISGHGAPLTAMALSPDGERLATASLDGRLRITSIAWAKLVHRLPLSDLPAGPERAKIEPQPLDESPYALMSEVTSSKFGEPTGEPFIVVYNARKSLSQALGARERAASAGLPDGLIYRRQGFFRGVFAFATEQARDEALARIREEFSGAYARDLRSWCPSPVENENFIDCPAAVAATEPPPAMAN